MALPLINLDDRTYQSLVEEAKKQIPIYAPNWTDHNAHDPGTTLVELFAWLTEIYIYRLNRITNNSKRKFLKLIGVEEADHIEDDALADASNDRWQGGGQLNFKQNLHGIGTESSSNFHLFRRNLADAQVGQP